MDFHKSSAVLFGENIDLIKETYQTESEQFSTNILTKTEKFTENDVGEFKTALFSFFRENKQFFENFFLQKYGNKAITYDINVK